MTDKTDQTDKEKIEAAATKHSDDNFYHKLKYTGPSSSFKAGAAWRDRNPGPHVMALVEALRNCVGQMRRSDIHKSESIWADHFRNMDNAIAQFDKAVKGE